MKKLVFEFSPLMTALLILAIILPIGTSLNASTSVYATADNCFITSPTSSAVAYSRINGQVPVTFTVGVSGGVTSNIDISIFLLSGTTVVGAPSTFLTSAVGDGVHTFTYNLTIPAGTANGTYGVRVDARHPSGSSTYTSSLPSTNSIVINSTATVIAPTLATPTSGSCSPINNPTFGWTHTTTTGDTYWFELATNSSFSPTMVSASTATTKSYGPVVLSELIGTYYWRVKTVDKYGNSSAWLTSSICIDTVAPTLPTLISPPNGNPIGGTYNPTYEWSISTDTSPCANNRYFVETFSGSCGGTLVDNVTGIANPQTGNPRVTASNALGSGTYYWRVTAYDCAGNTLGPTGCWSFSIPITCTTATIHLGTGWNLVSLPLCPSSATYITPAQLVALSDNASAIQLIWGYEAASSAWQYYVPGSGGPLENIYVYKGYWIQASSPANITIVGTSCPVPPQSLITATVYPGWNLVGFKSCTNLDADHYFGSTIFAALSFICGYSGGWNCAVTNLETTKGYWVYYGGTANGNYGLPCN